jgi:hypothetical protein
LVFTCVVEGKAEYYCIPSLLGRRSHVVTGVLNMQGGNNGKLSWETLLRTRVFPRVRGMALKQPDKVLVVLDREGRPDCSPTLAAEAVRLLQQDLNSENIVCNLCVVVCDRKFENAILADTHLVDRLNIIRGDHKFSALAPQTLDGIGVIGILADCMLPGKCYDKVEHGLALVRCLNYDDPTVLARSRCLRKLIKEM